MKLLHKKIAIVGAGPGGLTLARLLQMRGVSVKVYERDLDRYARVQGSPLDLHEDSGLAALEQAGLIEVFKANFMPGADREKIMNERAEVFFSDHDTKKIENFGDAGFRPEIDRGVLRQILLDSLEVDTVVWGRKFLGMVRNGEGWLLSFDHGDAVYADLVIAADGANSKIRPYLTDLKATYSGVTMLEGNITDAVNVAPGIEALLEGGKIMAFGKGQNLLLGQKANGEIGFYTSFKVDEFWSGSNGLDYADRDKLLAWFDDAYRDWSPVWRELLEQTSLPLIPRPIYSMPLDQSWESLPNLTLLGDAAHVMPPFAGEGVNMAMLDALELSEVLLTNGDLSIGEAIEAYEVKMRKRAAAVAKQSLDNGDRMHAEDALSWMLEFFSGHG